MAFEEIIGQEKLVDNLKKIICSNEISHAYLIDGLKGVGKKQFAISLSKAILCLNTNQELIGSDNCSSCKKFKDNNHPEFHVIEQDGSIKIEEIREIQKNIHIKPYEGNRKVYVILNGDKMTVQAQNALLKTLEEPPGHSTIIITTNNLKALLPTIISRCQLLKLRPQGIERVTNYLVEKLGINQEEARVTATFSNGLIEMAKNIYYSDDFKRRRFKVIDITEKLLSTNTMNILHEVEFFSTEKDNIEEIIDLFIYWYRDILIYKETQEDSLIINYDQYIKIQNQNKIIDFAKLRKAIIMLEEKKQQIRGNVNYLLAIESMLLNLQDLFNYN